MHSVCFLLVNEFTQFFVPRRVQRRFFLLFWLWLLLSFWLDGLFLLLRLVFNCIQLGSYFLIFICELYALFLELRYLHFLDLDLGVEGLDFVDGLGMELQAVLNFLAEGVPFWFPAQDEHVLFGGEAHVLRFAKAVKFIESVEECELPPPNMIDRVGVFCNFVVIGELQLDDWNCSKMARYLYIMVVE
jgi:hypothetical protein